MFEKITRLADLPARAAMAGGLLLLAKTGAPALSVDRMLSKTRGEHGWHAP